MILDHFFNLVLQDCSIRFYGGEKNQIQIHFLDGDWIDASCFPIPNHTFDFWEGVVSFQIAGETSVIRSAGDVFPISIGMTDIILAIIQNKI